MQTMAYGVGAEEGEARQGKAGRKEGEAYEEIAN